MAETKKHQQFVNESIGDKLLKALPGVGHFLVRKFTRKGYRKTSEVLGRFLVLKKDRDQFIEWFVFVADPMPHWEGRARGAEKYCYLGLKEWCDCWL